MKLRLALSAVAATLVFSLAFAAPAASPWCCSLKLASTPGESKTNNSGSGMIRSSTSLSSSRSSTRTVTKTLKWNAEVRFWKLGRVRPRLVELRVFYIGHHGGDSKLAILKREAHKVELDANGVAKIELTSPKVSYTRTKSVSGGFRSGSSSSKSTSGERIDGCIAQLVVDGRIEKVWTSNSVWEKRSWKEELNETTLNEKLRNALN